MLIPCSLRTTHLMLSLILKQKALLIPACILRVWDAESQWLPQNQPFTVSMWNTEPEATPHPICLTNQLMHMNNRSMVLCTNDSLREEKNLLCVGPEVFYWRYDLSYGCARDYPKPLLIWAGLILTIILASGNYYQPHYIQRRLKHGLISFPTITIKAFVCLFLRRKIDICTQYTSSWNEYFTRIFYFGMCDGFWYFLLVLYFVLCYFFLNSSYKSPHGHGASL